MAQVLLSQASHSLREVVVSLQRALLSYLRLSEQAASSRAASGWWVVIASRATEPGTVEVF